MRASWLILVLVAVVVAAASPLRDQARLQRCAGPAALLRLSEEPTEGMVTEGAGFRNVASIWMEALREHFEAFDPEYLSECERRYADEPKMLAAAAMDSQSRQRRDMPQPQDTWEQREKSTALLKQAAESHRAPAYWAAYVTQLMSGTSYHHLGTLVIDGDAGNPERVAQAQGVLESLASEGTPVQLDPERAQLMLDALHGWQHDEPENGLPVALEAWVLYGLHEDKKARSRLIEAAELPIADSHSREVRAMVERFLDREGAPAPERRWIGRHSVGVWSAVRLKDVARIARYEGTRAHIEGRDAEAVQLWDAAMAFSRHYQESVIANGGPYIEWAFAGVGFTLGARPVWDWRSDEMTGLSGGPLPSGRNEGRIFYGREHAVYVSEAGEEAQAEVREDLVKHYLRMDLAQQWRDSSGIRHDRYARAAFLLLVGVALVVQLASLLVIFLLVSARARRTADAAAGLGGRPKLITALMAALPVGAAGAAMSLWAPQAPVIPKQMLIGLLAFPAVVSLTLTLLVAVFRLRRGFGLLARWRGNLRAVLPAAGAVLALLYLGLATGAAVTRAHVERSCAQPEMTGLIQQLGPAWENPTIPDDAWRAQYPPEPPEKKAG